MKCKINGREIITPHSEQELRKIFPDAEIEVLTGDQDAGQEQSAAAPGEAPQEVRQEVGDPAEAGAGDGDDEAATDQT